MYGKWYQLFVRANDEGLNDPYSMLYVDRELLSRAPACFRVPHRIPVRESDGTYEVRCYLETAMPLVRAVLTETFRLEIVREVENGPYEDECQAPE